MPHRFIRQILLPALLATILGMTSHAFACQVPVFRYALERWSPEAFSVVVFHRGPMARADQKIVDSLGGGATPANLQPIDVDVNAALDGDSKALWQAQGDVPLPWVVLRYPSEEKSLPTWRGRLDSPELQQLADSPARRTIAAQLVAGDSTMWVLVKGGNRERDNAAAALLASQLKKLSDTIKLPEPDPAAFGSEAALSDLPLRLVFSSIMIDRADPAEQAFIPVLLHHDHELLEMKDPIVVPIFGRGRALACLSGKDLSADRIEEAAIFLSSKCSCQVKELNPGYDLLMSADWDSILRSGHPQTQPSAPVAVGAAEEPRSVAAAELPPAPILAAEHDPSSTRRRMVTLAIGILSIVAVALGWVALRGGIRSRR